MPFISTVRPGHRTPRRLAAAAIAATLLAGAAAKAGEPVRSLLEMRRDNVVIQEWDLSCGAAALTTVLNQQFGDPVEEKEIAKALISRQEYIDNPKLVQVRQGFSLLDLKRVAESRGYVGTGYGKMTVDDLIERAPVLVPIMANGYNHFVIFRGQMADRVLVADPAFGNYTMRIQKFENAWIEYPEFGKVGFVLSARDGRTPRNGLAPRPEDFVALR
ncbi:MAG: C39 family peptidase [Rhodospirillales bacterium]|nr:C39 family peptidase [Rhodospirillales bacterium]